jgi:hypothetical protein
MIAPTQGMVGKHLDNVTLSDLSVLSALNHRFEICFQRYESRYPSIDFLKPCLSNQIRASAWLILSVS